QQRVALARALVTRPDILFADEPTGNLDARSGQQVLDILFELCGAEQGTLVMVTHNDAAAARADRVLCLSQGRLQRVDTTTPEAPRVGG
ncbi:MAG: ABC transporter ATP-binding protein, partial [Gammaproteobacteria bacterium]|nr:ABC transporter ATP-binding protein [Gammaproteobacteria bacterium]